MEAAGQFVGTVVGRWYVTIFGILAENASVHVGVPYTRYSFNPDLRGQELWVGDMPLCTPLSYTFMAYFAFGVARLLVAGPYSTRSRQTGLDTRPQTTTGMRGESL